MRGIAELVEVMKSSPPTPSPIPPHISPSSQLNGGVPLDDQHHLPDEDLKTPEPPVVQNEPANISAPPTDIVPPSEVNPVPPSAAAPMVYEPHTQSHPPSLPTGSSSFSKMKTMLAQQMGLIPGGNEEEEETDGEINHAPSHSPSVQRRVGPQVSQHPPGNRHSVPSSSNRSEKVDTRRSLMEVGVNREPIQDSKSECMYI